MTFLLPGRAASQSRVGPPPPGTDPFFAKYVDADGIAILGSAKVQDPTFAVAREIVTHMLAKRPDLARRIAGYGAKVLIFAVDEDLTDLPGRSFRKGTVDPEGLRWEARTGGGGTRERPDTMISERNLIGVGDPFHGHLVALVHEFGHTIGNLGLDDSTRGALAQAYRHAKARDLFRTGGGKPSHMMNNEHEFFAAASTIWFTGSIAPGTPNLPAVTSRNELKTYDPELHGILAQIYPDDSWQPPHPH